MASLSAENLIFVIHITQIKMSCQRFELKLKKYLEKYMEKRNF